MVERGSFHLLREGKDEREARISCEVFESDFLSSK
jgi:hypothetical protein